jgi:transcriptional regulator with XRE-family HTH domain
MTEREPSIRTLGSREDGRFDGSPHWFDQWKHSTAQVFVCQQVGSPAGKPVVQFFGTKLRYLRQQRHLRQVDLAKALALATHAHVANLETGRKAPSLHLVIRAADLFTVSTDYLLRDTIPVEHIGTTAAESSPDSVRCERVVMGTSGTATISASKSATKPFGRKLNYLRMRHGITQIDLARQLELNSSSHVSYLEAGRKEPSSDLVLRIADLFGVTTDYLLLDNIAVEAIEFWHPDDDAEQGVQS